MQAVNCTVGNISASEPAFVCRAFVLNNGLFAHHAVIFIASCVFLMQSIMPHLGGRNTGVHIDDQVGNRSVAQHCFIKTGGDCAVCQRCIPHYAVCYWLHTALRRLMGINNVCIIYDSLCV